VQAGIVAVLCLLALFTHNHVFWIIAILLAFIRIPDFETPIYSISDSLKRLAYPPPPVMAEREEPLPAPIADAPAPSQAPVADDEKREA
jgi:hypothetical protein